MKKIFILFLLIFNFLLTFAFNIRIAPTGFNEVIDRPVSREVYVINETLEPIRVMVDVEEDEIYSDYSLKEYIKVFPKLLTIPPKGKRIARFRINPPKDLEEGQYKVFLTFQELERERTKEDIIEDIAEEEGVKVDIKMLTNIGISVYGYRGEIDQSVNIENTEISRDGQNIVVDTTATAEGNSSVTIIGKFNYYDSSNKAIGEDIKGGTIFRDQKDTIRMILENIPSALSVIEVIYENRKGEFIKKEKIEI